ncbi:hypothetical protein MTO96_020929 [Rhipicephalus appendiculatus]
MYILKECVDFVNIPNTSGYVRALQAHFENAKVICDLCWEMLNVGDWKNVQLCWRQMYSFGSLLKTLCELGLEKPTKVRIQNASLVSRSTLSRMSRSGYLVESVY